MSVFGQHEMGRILRVEYSVDILTLFLTFNTKVLVRAHKDDFAFCSKIAAAIKDFDIILANGIGLASLDIQRLHASLYFERLSLPDFIKHISRRGPHKPPQV